MSDNKKWLRKGDSEKPLAGKVIWVMGLRDSGKTTLVDALQKALQPEPVIIADDFLRCRTGITGRDNRAYSQMIGLGYSLAYQGIDVLIPSGCRSRELRDRIRAEIPSSIFVYIADRGWANIPYEPPAADEKVLTLPGELTTKKEVEICLKEIWKRRRTNNSMS